MKPENFDIQELVEALQGTCDTLDSKLPEGMEWEDLTDEDHAYIDQEKFCCEECGWWYENCEMSQDENAKCLDCKPDEED